MSVVRHPAVLVAVAAIALASCGRKNRPVAPELVRPESPEELSAVATPDGVRLTWVRPLRYTGGGKMNDLGAFDIERAPGEGAAPEFHRIGTVTVEDQDRFRKERHMEWIDRDVTPGARYLYRLTAVTLDRYRSAPAGPVAVRYVPASGASPSAPQ